MIFIYPVDILLHKMRVIEDNLRFFLLKLSSSNTSLTSKGFTSLERKQTLNSYIPGKKSELQCRDSSIRNYTSRNHLQRYEKRIESCIFCSKIVDIKNDVFEKLSTVRDVKETKNWTDC